MSIQTWLGMGCEIVNYDKETNIATIKCDDGEIRKRHISELRADNGIAEIRKAIKEVLN